MKHIRTYQQLNESMTDTLYHFTDHLSLMNMLKDNQINLTLAVGSTADFNVNKKKFNFLSMQTTRNSGYGKRRSLPVMIVMDGEKLNHNFKGGPVDYWQTKGNHKVKHDMDEFEERLVSDNSDIPLDKFVKEIHVWLKPNNWSKPDSKDTLEMMKQAAFDKKKADEYNIPIYFYDTEVAYFNNAKGRAIDIKAEGDPEAYDYDNRSSGAFSILSVIVGSDEEQQEYLADRIVFNKFIDERMPDATKQERTDQIKKTLKDFSDKWMLAYVEKWVNENPGTDKNSPYDYKMADMYSSVEANIHNGRSTRNKFLKWTFDMLKKDMRKTKSTNFKDYMQKKYGKF